MTAARCFRKAFTKKNLAKIYEDKVQFRASVGMDHITPQVFEQKLDNEIRIISDKVQSGTYQFTRYREVLISKGRGKEPRIISIPTIRDKLALAACHMFLQETYRDVIDEPLLHTIVGDITQCVQSGAYTGYVKVDITKFYASINHDILLKKVKQRIRKKEALVLLENAITTQTIARGTTAPQKEKTNVGVPEGLSISNILADIYLTDLKTTVCNEYDVKFFRYVDDILILCDVNQAEKIKLFVVDVLCREFALSANTDKTVAGKLEEGVPFLGYVFSDRKIGIRPAAKQKIENSIEELFRRRKAGNISHPLFLWRLNLRIAGCILDAKKYGWLFYYSQLNDLKVLFQLDWFVNRLFKRFHINKPGEIKSFVRTYHEITKNVSHSDYLFNVDRYSVEKKREILTGIYGEKKMDTLDDDVIKSLFKEAMFKEIQRLEQDIQNFS